MSSTYGGTAKRECTITSTIREIFIEASIWDPLSYYSFQTISRDDETHNWIVGILVTRIKVPISMPTCYFFLIDYTRLSLFK